MNDTGSRYDLCWNNVFHLYMETFKTEWDIADVRSTTWLWDINNIQSVMLVDGACTTSVLHEFKILLVSGFAVALVVNGTLLFTYL